MPVWAVVILSVAALVALLLLVRVRLVIVCTDRVTLSWRVLFFGRRLYPRPRPRLSRYSPKALAKRAEKEQKKALKKQKRKEEHKTSRQTGKTPAEPSLKRKLGLITAMVRALAGLCRKHLHLYAARLDVRVATGDAASTAVLYGAVSAALAGLLAALDTVAEVRARPPRVRVTADYLHDTPSIDAKLVFYVRVGGALALLFSAALTYLKYKKKSKTRNR